MLQAYVACIEYTRFVYLCLFDANCFHTKMLLLRNVSFLEICPIETCLKCMELPQSYYIDLFVNQGT